MHDSVSLRIWGVCSAHPPIVHVLWLEAFEHLDVVCVLERDVPLRGGGILEGFPVHHDKLLVEIVWRAKDDFLSIDLG